MKRLLSLMISAVLIMTSSSITYADQVWGDAVAVTGSNHDQLIELTVNEGDTWQTPLNVYVVKSGQSVSFPVSGQVNYSEGLLVDETAWQVNAYDSPDNLMVSKTESEAGFYHYEVVFEAVTDLGALSKSFDKVIIKVNVLEVIEPEIDTVAPIVMAPNDVILEATAILTPVDVGMATTDDPLAVISNDSPGMFPIGESLITWFAEDPSGNIGSDIQKITIVDTTPPEFTTLPQNKSVILSGALTPVDLGQVLATDIFPVTLTNNAPAGGFALGETLVTWTATDSNGNSRTVTQIISVHYKFEGFYQPINMDGSSLFKQGSTIPIKFRLFDANQQFVTTAIASLKVAKVTDHIAGTQEEAISTSNATIGNLFRYDFISNQYIFNLNTKPLSKGTYVLYAYLDDGKVYSVVISLR